VPAATGETAKGVVEKANHTAAHRWWRTLPDDVTAAQAQALLDQFCERVTDRRRRIDADGNRCTVADLAAAEQLRPVPTVPPIAVLTVTRKATAQALVHYRGNRYSLPPELAGATVTHRVGATTLAIVTPSGVTVAVHPRRADGTGATDRTDQHVTALNTAAMAASSSAAPHRSKRRVPPGPDARAAADALRAKTVAGRSDRVRTRRRLIGQYGVCPRAAGNGGVQVKAVATAEATPLARAGDSREPAAVCT